MSLLLRHVMAEAPQTVTPEATVEEAASLMAEHDVGAIPVVGRDGEPRGVVTDRDLVLRVLVFRKDPSSTAVQEVMTEQDLVTLSPDAQVSEARALMAERRVRRILVTKDGRLVGVVSIGDVAEAEASKRAVGEALEEISASGQTLRRNDGPATGTPARVRG
jgi:CBS domain-containing protein